MKQLIIFAISSVLILNSVGCVITFTEPPNQSPPQFTPSSPPSSSPIDKNWQPSMQSQTSQLLPSIADAVEVAFPAVVAINTETVAIDFFSRSQTQTGAGSRWIIDKNGIIVTNNHVVEGAKKVNIEMVNGSTFEVSIDKVYRDPLTDIAIIKVNESNLPAATIGDSGKLRVGDWVVALGNPLGKGLRAKEGTVSGLKVSLMVDQGQTLDDLIETSAAINPGNSGGPLINLAGQVIGITSAKMAAIGVEGMGYAISMRAALPIIEQLITQGYVIRPYLGIAPVTIDQYYATVYRLPVTKGVLIANDVELNSPAGKAGLRKFDIITHFKNKEIATTEEILDAIHTSNIGEEVSITYIRDGNTRTVQTRLLQSPAPRN